MPWYLKSFIYSFMIDANVSFQQIHITIIKADDHLTADIYYCCFAINILFIFKRVLKVLNKRKYKRKSFELDVICICFKTLLYLTSVLHRNWRCLMILAGVLCWPYIYIIYRKWEKESAHFTISYLDKVNTRG